MNDEGFTSYNVDKVMDDGDAEIYATEYLNTVNLSNLPPHELKLKIDALSFCYAILVHLLDCAMEHVFVSSESVRIVECEILDGKYAGNTIIIPRIPLSSSSIMNLSFEFRWTQFPLRLAFAMTINKAQGQTLKNVELCLTESVFTYRQLYIALSRITNDANLRMIVPDIEEACQQGKIKNCSLFRSI